MAWLVIQIFCLSLCLNIVLVRGVQKNYPCYPLNKETNNTKWALHCINKLNCTRSDDNKIVCKCLPGFNGKICQNGGICRNLGNLSYSTCNCPEGFKGAYCEKKTVMLALNKLDNNQENNTHSLTTVKKLTKSGLTINTKPENKSSSINLQRVVGILNFQNRTNLLTKILSEKPPKDKVTPLPIDISILENPCKTARGQIACLNGGVCINVDNLSFECHCSNSFTGEFCEFINACKDNRCLNGGTCQSFEDSGVCNCLEGYAGTFCELRESGSVYFTHEQPDSIEADYLLETRNSLVPLSLRTKLSRTLIKKHSTLCATNSCINGGICSVLPDKSYECECSEQYTGKYCQFLNACLNLPCKNGGTCESYEDSGVCNCPNGFTGTYCNKIDDDRDPSRFVTVSIQNTSMNQVPNTKPSLKRTTSPHTNLTRNQSTVHDPCSRVPNPCKNNGRCFPIDNKSFECECYTEYTGDFCQFRNPCYDVPCKNGGTCEAFDDSGVCTCGFGFTGTFCEKEIESSSIQYNVSADFDYITSSPKVSKMHSKSTVVNVGSPCYDNAEKRCLNGGTCIPHKSTYDCECSEEYVGAYCQFDNACMKNPCKNGGVCESYEDSGVCNCPNGFTSIYCEEIDDSTESYLNKGRTFSFKKRRLIVLTDIDHCHNSEDDNGKPSCLNGGRCVILDEDTYGCECPLAYTGPYCEFVDVCVSAPCINGGTCESYEDSGICTCPTGFSGSYCEESADHNDNTNPQLALSIETEIQSSPAELPGKDNIVEHLYRSKIPAQTPYPSFLQMKTQGVYAHVGRSFNKEHVISIPGFEDINKDMIRIANDGTIYIRKPKRTSKSPVTVAEDILLTPSPFSEDEDDTVSGSKLKRNRILDANIVKVMPNGELFIKVKIPNHKLK